MCVWRVPKATVSGSSGGVRLPFQLQIYAYILLVVRFEEKMNIIEGKSIINIVPLFRKLCAK